MDAKQAIKVLEPDCQEPKLLFKFRDREAPLRTVLAQVEVKVVGCLVEVEQTLSFQSDEKRCRAGELEIPLPERAAVCGFAVGDSPETLIEAQIVERKAARMAFEAAVRKRRPVAALLEKTEASSSAGRLYKTRIYPIHPGSTKTVRLTYTDTLQPRRQPASAKCHWALGWLNGLELLSAAAVSRELGLAVASATLRLALPFQSAERCELRVHVAGNAVLLPSSLPLKFMDGAAVYEAKALRGMLALAVPELLGGRAQVWLERDSRDSASAFWLAYDSPAPLLPSATAREIRHLAVAWDASMSREGSPDLFLLNGVLQGLPAACLVSCLCFDVDTEWLQVGAADRASVLKSVVTRPFDGGTSYGALNFSCPDGHPVDAWLVFTDGLCSLGERLGEPAQSPAAGAPIFVATRSASASGLCDLAAVSGGCVFDSASCTAESILHRIAEPAFGFQGLGEQRGVCHVYPDRPTRTEPGERLLLVGRLREAATTVTVRYGFTGEAPTSTRYLRVDAAEAEVARAGGVISRLWAQRRIAALEGHASAAAERLALARKHGVVTQNASLLVLTTLQEYQEQGLVPAQADLRAEYLAGVERKEQEEAERERAKLQKVAQYWRDRTTWWEQDRKAELQQHARRSAEGWEKIQRRHREAFAAAMPRGSRRERQAFALAGASAMQALTVLGLPFTDAHVMEEDARMLLAGAEPIRSRHDFALLAARLGALGALRRLGDEGFCAAAERRAPWLFAAAGKPHFSSYLPLLLQAHRAPTAPRPQRQQEDVEFSSDVVAVLRRAFDRVDTDKNGRVNSLELQAVVSSLKLLGGLEPADLQGLNRRLCFEDFLKLMRQRLWPVQTCDRAHREEASSVPAMPAPELSAGLAARASAGPQIRLCAGLAACGFSGEAEEAQEPVEAEAAEGAEEVEAGRAAAIELKPWDPDTPYLARIKAARPGGVSAAYAAYLAERKEHGQAPSFFLGTASYLFNEAKTASEEEGPSWRRLATRVLSSICELGVEDPKLLRLAAYGMEAGGSLRLAEQLFRDVLRLRPEEPQSHRDLANLLARRWKARYFPGGDPEACSKGSASAYGDEEARRDARQSFSLWQAVLKGCWDERFDEIELIALMEMSGALAFAHAVEPLQTVAAEVEEEFARLGHPDFGRALPCSMRVSMAWDTDDTDIDIHVLEPTGETASYSHRNTSIGGLVSRDFTEGYGPEEYVLREGASGSYTIHAKYYASHRQDLAGATTVLLTFFTDFAVPGRERRGQMTLRLESSEEMAEVGTVQLTDPTWESIKRNAEAEVYVEAALDGWRAHAERAAPCLQRWWFAQRLLKPLELQPEPKTRRGRSRVLQQLRAWGCVESGAIDREKLLQLLRELGMKAALEMLEAQGPGSGAVDYQTFTRWLSACKGRGAAAGVVAAEAEAPQ